MKRLFMVLFGLASLHAAATAAKTAGEEKTPGKNAGAAASLWPEKMDPSFQGSRPECFKIWVIRNLRFPADRYDVGDEAKVEVVFAIDGNTGHAFHDGVHIVGYDGSKCVHGSG